MRQTLGPTFPPLLAALALLAAALLPAAPAGGEACPGGACPPPVLRNTDFSGGTFGYLEGECPVGYEPRVEGNPAEPPRFGAGTAGVTLEAAVPMRCELRQPLHAGFGRTIAYIVPVSVAGDAEFRVGIVRHENPEDADWSAPAGSGEASLRVEARADHPGAFLCLRFDVRSTGPASLRIPVIALADVPPPGQ